MSNRPNPALAGLAAACVLFIFLIAAARLQALVALGLAIAGGGATLAVLSRGRHASTRDQPSPVTVPVVPPPPVQFQEHAITGVRLRSALADYNFVFSATVLWLPSPGRVGGTGELAGDEVVRRADEITKCRDPNEATFIASDLTPALGMLQPDRSGRVQAKAEYIRLQVLPEDKLRLEELARLRKEEGLWEYQRRYQVNKRRYLRTDVLKDPGSAVVWWLAKHEDDPRQVAESIDVLVRLAEAANGGNDAAPTASAAPDDAPISPETPAERFGAFLDSLDPPPGDKDRLLLTDLVARFVDSYDQKAADDMRRRYSEPEGGDVVDGYWGYPGEAEDTLPE
jgi:hypothetical protein